jgi:glycine betaine/choline ABC-type transport system substrate-binding protein
VREILKSVMLAGALALGAATQAHGAVVVSSKLSSESAMLGEMIRMMLNEATIGTVDRTRLGATYVV